MTEYNQLPSEYLGKRQEVAWWINGRMQKSSQVNKCLNFKIGKCYNDKISYYSEKVNEWSNAKCDELIKN